MALIVNLDTALAGPWPGHGSHVLTRASFIRPANTTLYTAADVVGQGVARAIVFPECGPSGVIMNAQLIVEENDGQTFELFVFDDEPTNFADNETIAMVTGDVPKMVGMFNFDTSGPSHFPSSTGVGIKYYDALLDSATSNPVAYVTADGKNLYGLLVVRTGWTPASGIKINLSLGLERD